MFDRNSDYALNKKDPDAIVCKSSTGVHIRLTRLDFSSQEEFEKWKPSQEEFEKWKQWSDDDYHCTEKKDHVYANHTVPTDKLVEVSITVISPEEELMKAYDRQERERLYTCPATQNRIKCTAHYIRVVVLEQLVLQNLQRVMADAACPALLPDGLRRRSHNTEHLSCAGERSKYGGDDRYASGRRSAGGDPIPRGDWKRPIARGGDKYHGEHPKDSIFAG